MILLSVVTNYQLIEVMVYKITRLKHEKCILMIGKPIIDKYPQYQMLKNFFDDVIVYETNVEYTNDFTDTTLYFNDLLQKHGVNIKDFSDIYVGSAHFKFGIYLYQCNVPFIYFEEVAGGISRPKILKKIESDFFYRRAEALDKIGMFDGSNKYIKKIIYDKYHVDTGFVSNKPLEHFSVEEELSTLSFTERNKIIEFFLNGKRYRANENSVIIFTEHLANLKITSLEYQCIIYQTFIDYFFRDKHIIFKPHPDDILFYNELFPESTIIQEKFPSEIIPYIFIELPKIAAGISTTSLYNMTSVFNKIISLDFTYSRDSIIIDSIHQYFVAFHIINYLQIKPYFINTYDKFIEYYNQYLFNEILDYSSDNLCIYDCYKSQDSLQEIINLKQNDIIIFLNFNLYNFSILNNYLFMEQLLPIFIQKISVRDNDIYSNTNDEVIYIYTNNEEIKTRLYTMNYEKELKNTGLNIKVVPLDIKERRIKVLEGILDATEKRLLYEMEKNKALLMELEKLERDK